ncbi:MAG: hypothetical protein AAGD10_08085 [Myxococcota bacterium]
MLANLCAVPGVRGAALFDSAGQCVEAELQPPYEADFLGGVLRSALGGLDAHQVLDGKPSRAAFARAEHGCIGVLRTGAFELVALTDRDADPRQIWVAFGALEAKLARGLEESQAGSFISSSDLPAPSAPVPAPILDAIEAALSQHMGPVARVLLLDALNALGATLGTLSEAQLPELVRRLEQSIERPSQRRSFRQAVAPLLSG